MGFSIASGTGVKSIGDGQADPDQRALVSTTGRPSTSSRIWPRARRQGVLREHGIPAELTSDWELVASGRGDIHPGATECGPMPKNSCPGLTWSDGLGLRLEPVRQPSVN